jgi:hypothetical protein
MKTKEEIRPISDLAKNAAAMVAETHSQMLQAAMNRVADDALASMGLSPADGWVVHFGRGVALRQAPRGRAPDKSKKRRHG